MQGDNNPVRPTSAREVRPDVTSASRPDAPSSGFTAVNGERHVPLFRPNTSAPATKPQTRETRDQGRSPLPEPARQSPADRTLLWRPVEPGEIMHMNKRKRADSTGQEASHDTSRAAAGPSTNEKRPALGNLSANARSPERTSVEGSHRGVETAMVPTYVREPSPDSTRWNNGEPPPPPLPHIESGLVESVRRENWSLRDHGRKPDSPADRSQLHAERSASSSRSASPEGEVQEHSPGGTPALPRKRMFSNRTKTGCHTCRARKKKCDEGKPYCRNCIRGDFHCKGYGPKRPGDDKVERAKQYPGVVPHPYYYPDPHAHMMSMHHPPPPEMSPLHYYPPPDPAHPSQGNTHWGRSTTRVSSRPRPEPPPGYHDPTPIDYLQSNGNRDPWPPHGATAPTGPDRAPSDYNLPPPVSSYGPSRPPEPWHPPAPPGPAYRPPTASGSAISGHDSVATSSSSTSHQLPLSYRPSGELSERSKMITGQPYRHFLDDELLRDRNSCKRAIEAYNDATRASSTVSPAEKERLFKAVLDPSARAYDGDHALYWHAPKGTCGARVIVECPFTCEFGYKVHFGDDAVISRNCHMQDSCDIYIGNRSVVGPNVKFYCMTADLDAEAGVRRGSQGNFRAGVIRVEDDVYIGADVIIMPYRTIGRGAVVGAGSVVTKDVKPFTVVAGNPAKVIRRIDPGKNDERHANPDIQEQNERMLQRMQSGLDKGYRDRFIR